MRRTPNSGCEPISMQPRSNDLGPFVDRLRVEIDLLVGADHMGRRVDLAGSHARQVEAVLDLSATSHRLAERYHGVAGVDGIPQEATRDRAGLHQLASLAGDEGADD